MTDLAIPPHMAETPWGRAYTAYIAEHPEPRREDFPCPRCRARPGQPCIIHGNAVGVAHAPRVDRMIRAHQKRHIAAVRAADAAMDAHIREATR